MTTTTEQYGTFSDIVKVYTRQAIESGQLDLSDITPNDMRREIEAALFGGETESEIHYATWHYPGDAESRHYCFFPNAGRGAVCMGGMSEWSDASDLDDLEARWESIGTDEENWSN